MGKNSGASTFHKGTAEAVARCSDGAAATLFIEITKEEINNKTPGKTINRLGLFFSYISQFEMIIIYINMIVFMKKAISLYTLQILI